MNIHIKCCPFCGSEFITKWHKFISCDDCSEYDKILFNKYDKIIFKKIIPYISKYPKEYYENISLEKYNTKEKWKDVFIEIELSQQTLFSSERYKFSVKEQKERDIRKAEQQNKPAYNPTEHLPKCPTCGSINIQKISSVSRITSAAMFGFFSKTARSQFECKNCGYKW